jgi:hypothetical protein
MKILKQVYGIGGYDVTKENNNLIAQVTAVQVDGVYIVTLEDGSTRQANVEEILFLIRAQEQL